MIAGKTAIERQAPEVKPYRCCDCRYSQQARGSLRGIWLYCDHPESFKRFVPWLSSCECWMPRSAGEHA